MANTLKRLMGFAAHRSGALRLVQRLNDRCVRILMYHRFPQQHAENFDQQCQLLREQYDVVSLPEAVRRLESGESLHDVVAMTIDDGHADMHNVAFPILQKHRLPATLFVTTGFIDRTCWMPGDHVRYFFSQAKGRSLTVRDDAGVQHTFRAGEEGAADRLREMMKRVSNRTRAAMLAELAVAAPGQSEANVPPEFAPCTWQQLRTMAKRGITMGAHTITHPILSKVEDVAEKERELLASKARLEFQLDREIETFAYPNGGSRDYDAESLDVARRAFRSAVTAIYGLNVMGADPHQLLRLPCDPDLPVPALARMLAGPVRHRVQTPSLMKAAS